MFDHTDVHPFSNPRPSSPYLQNPLPLMTPIFLPPLSLFYNIQFSFFIPQPSLHYHKLSFHLHLKAQQSPANQYIWELFSFLALPFMHQYSKPLFFLCPFGLYLLVPPSLQFTSPLPLCWQRTARLERMVAGVLENQPLVCCSDPVCRQILYHIVRKHITIYQR